MRRKILVPLVLSLGFLASLANCVGSEIAPNQSAPGTQDAGTQKESGAPSDGGTQADSGTQTEGGTPTDGGTQTDSGTPTDGGAQGDSGGDSGTIGVDGGCAKCVLGSAALGACCLGP
jgi:hypothetical protein